MPDDDPRERYSDLADIKDDYETAGNDETDSNDGTDEHERNDSSESMTETASKDSNDGNAVSDAIDGSEGDAGTDGVKDSRENVQAYIPASEKEQLEEAFRKVKAICNLSDRDEPLKNDFYAAAFRHGHQDLEAIAEYLGLSEAYDEYGEMVD